MKECLLSCINLKECNPRCEVNDLSSDLVNMLVFAQDLARFQFTITSGFRSQAYERLKGRTGTSSHCRGLAVDISTVDSYIRYKVVQSALLSGFTRIGIGKRFVHLDIDETKAHPVIFHYYD